MASTGLYLILAVSAIVICANAASTGKAINATDIPATPAATNCKSNLAAAMTQFTAGGIAAVTQVAGAVSSNYIYCLEYKPTAKDTATFVLHIEPSFVNVPFANIGAVAPQLPGFVNAAYVAGADMKANGDFGLVTYPWDLANKSNPTPTTQKTSLIELFSKGTDSYICGCGIASATSSTRRMLQ